MRYVESVLLQFTGNAVKYASSIKTYKSYMKQISLMKFLLGLLDILVYHLVKKKFENFTWPIFTITCCVMVTLK